MSKKSTNDARPALIVFGEDEDGKVRAGWFASEDAETAQTAAQQLGFRCVTVENEYHVELTRLLQPGNVHGADKKFIPVARKSAHPGLVELAGGAGSSPDAPMPKNWDAIKSGDIVIAHEGKTEGWWEAIVIKRNGDSLTIRWRDYPKQSKVQRHRSQIALPFA